jgi:hypothetical protein
LTVYNLDTMDIAALQQFHDRLDTYFIDEAATLYPDRPEGYLEACAGLVLYAQFRLMADLHRRAGRWQAAERTEQSLQSFHDDLPAWARWK